MFIVLLFLCNKTIIEILIVIVVRLFEKIINHATYYKKIINQAGYCKKIINYAEYY